MNADLIEVEVRAVTENGRGNIGLELVLSNGTDLPAYEAGAHIDVITPAGIKRPYSLCGSPDDRSIYELCVKQVEGSRGGSLSLHRDVAVGDRLKISMPRNAFPLPEASRYLLFAGGIGITPLMAMAETLVRRSASFNLHYYIAKWERAAFAGRLEEARFADKVVFHYSENGDSLRYAVPSCLDHPHPGAAIMVCGPDGFIERLKNAAIVNGWQPEQFHSERFTSPEPSSFSSSGSFQVKLQSCGRIFRVEPHETIAEVLKRNGVSVELSCEQGMCGACLTKVISGIPDHRDSVQSDSEKAGNGHITICCSRSRSEQIELGI